MILFPLLNLTFRRPERKSGCADLSSRPRLCTLCLHFPSKMLLLNAKFFPPKCSVNALQKKSVKRSLAAHYKKAFLPQITAQVMWRLMRLPIDNAPAHWWPNQHGGPPQNYCWNLSSAWLYYHSIWNYFLNLECKSSFFRKKKMFSFYLKKIVF